MDTIDVRDLPEPIARAIAETVKNLKREFSKPSPPQPGGLPVRPLGVISPLNREAIYDFLHGEV